MDEVSRNELDAERRSELLQQELDALQNSASYKIGRGITALPRAARRVLSCLKERGPAGAVHYWATYLRYHKTGGENYAYWACLRPDQYRPALEKWYKENFYTHEDPHLDNPVLFSEKTQWFKLYGELNKRGPLVDKYLVRDWVKKTIGEEYLTKLYGVYDSFDEIDFDKLPDRFALKTNHGAGWNIIVRDKSKLDKAAAKKKMDTWMSLNYSYYIGGLECQYEHIDRKILVEEYLENDGGDLYDYKFLCSYGVPNYIIYISDRLTAGNERIRFYDTDWNVQPFTVNVPVGDPTPDPRPHNLEKMLALAAKLAEGIPYVRVDLYSLPGDRIVFGEMTFITQSGLPCWHPAEGNKIVGDTMKLPPRVEM